MKSSNKIFRYLLYILPLVLFFSYHPLIHFGTGESMNFEISLPLIWLVIFDVYGLFMILKFRKIKEILRNYVWLLFPIFMTISLIWTYDLLRGILIGGVLWLIYFAGYSIYIFRKEISDKGFWKNFFKVFLYSSLFVCFWCVLQCVLDVLGVGREYSLACTGCTYEIFGFPHPNGFAAEPQFMGNLLLAPIVMTIYLLEKKNYFSRKFLLICLFVFIATLFLTLSRGAIYAFGVGLVFFVITKIVKEKRWQSLALFVLTFLAFLFTLNLQGIFADFSPTNDTYVSGVSKVVNQLTLGKVDLGGSKVKKEEVEEKETEVETETAIFDGYVEVSTSGRTEVWKGALKTWSKDFKTIMFGVGLGGGLKGMYESGNYPSSQENVNNEYINVLLEGGLVGVLLLILSLILAFKIIYKMSGRLYLFTLVIIYLVSLLFFSGLPNVLQIYLLPVVFTRFYGKS